MAGTYEVATSKGTLVAPLGNVMLPACGKKDALKFRSRTPGMPCSRSAACPAGASATIDAATRSPLTITLRLIETAFGPLEAQTSLNVPPLGGTRRHPCAHSCWKVHVPRPVPCAGKQLKRIPCCPPIGAMPPHIEPLHWIRAPAWDPLEKSAGRGCAVTVSVTVRVVPFADAVITGEKASPL